MPWISSTGGTLFVVALIGVVAVVLIERMVSGRSRDRQRGDGRGSGESAGSGAFGELVDVFQPSRVHLTEEKERQRLDIAQAPSTAPPIDVDLESGVVVFSADVDEQRAAGSHDLDDLDGPDPARP